MAHGGAVIHTLYTFTPHTYERHGPWDAVGRREHVARRTPFSHAHGSGATELITKHCPFSSKFSSDKFSSVQFQSSVQFSSVRTPHTHGNHSSHGNHPWNAVRHYGTLEEACGAHRHHPLALSHAGNMPAEGGVGIAKTALMWMRQYLDGRGSKRVRT